MAIVGKTDFAFLEEEENLRNVENRIDYIIQDKIKRVEKLQDEINDYYVLDGEDLENKQYLIGRKWRDSSRIERLEEYKPSPYFGRFDMEKDDEINMYFVGKNELTDGGEIIILDWRSPLGMTFYNKREHDFNVKGNSYKLLLRRAVDIQDEVLIAVSTEYDSMDLSLEGEVVDPFLIHVLKDKRRDYKLTDIIRTIQSNQNDIIARPLDENFVVQGCAGSGKTMILLHRLSFIAFNYPEVSFSRFCILTPHEAFNLHIDELSSELGLDKIKRYTVESFYATLIASRSHVDNVASSKANNPIQKIPATAEGLISEKMLNSDLLKYLYSEDLYNKIEESYWDKSEKAADKINNLKVRDLLKQYGKKVDVIIDMNYKSFASYSSALNDVITTHEAAVARTKEQMANVKVQEERFNNAIKDRDDNAFILGQLKDHMIKSCDKFIEDTKEERDSLNLAINELNDKLTPITAERDAAREKIKESETGQGSNNRDVDAITTFGYLSTHNDDLSEMIKDLLSEDYLAIENLYSQADSLAFYNFGRKARLRAEAREIEERIKEKAIDIINIYDQDEKTRLKDLIDREASLCDTITELKTERDKSIIRADRINREFDRLNTCRNILTSGDVPNISGLTDAFSSEYVSKQADQYRAVFNSYKDNEKQCEIQKRILDSEVNKYDAFEKELLPDADISKLKKAKSIVDEFDMTKLYSDFESMLESIYEDYGQTYSSRYNYRHMLYLKLLLTSLYYGPAQNMGYYISIDEAQDLAKTEYRVLKSVLGDKTVFNLYGDINQLIYDYKGINEWEDITDEEEYKQYYLNENYRNTIEITKFCNDEFWAGITAIGLSGSPVKKLGFKDALKELESLHKQNPKYRCAIIYRRGLQNVKETVGGLLKNKYVLGEIDERAISVITVEESKGMEFDAVLVIQNDMTPNERYISYTRALDNLIISEIG